MRKNKLSIVFLGFFVLMSFSQGQIISQYIETNDGTTPKGIEIWNNTAGTLDFSSNNLVIKKGVNGGAPNDDFTLSSGTLSSNAVIVIGTSNMEATAVGNGATFHLKPFTFNGDDALEVHYGLTKTDVFGNPGSDPGSEWTGSSVSSKNQNISLKSGVQTGDTDGWTDPSLRFETTSTDPVNDQTGFGIAPTGDGSLPVELSAWSATSTKGNVALSWTTESEIENLGFVVYRKQNSESRSQELASFQTDKALLGHGSTSSRNSYSYIDTDVEVGQTYTYQLSDVDYQGKMTQHAEISVTVKAQEQDLKPTAMMLHAAYPNPFNPETTISFAITGETLRATSLRVYDVNGRFVATLYDGDTEPGNYTVKWDSGNFASGIYYMRLSSGNDIQIQRVTLLR